MAKIYNPNPLESIKIGDTLSFYDDMIKTVVTGTVTARSLDAVIMKTAEGKIVTCWVRQLWNDEDALCRKAGYENLPLSAKVAEHIQNVPDLIRYCISNDFTGSDAKDKRDAVSSICMKLFMFDPFRKDAPADDAGNTAEEENTDGRDE